MNQHEIDNLIQENVRLGLMKHVGFKNGEDLFSLTKKGIQKGKNLLTSDPGYVLFMLNLAYNMDGKKGFYEVIKLVVELLKESEK